MFICNSSLSFAKCSHPFFCVFFFFEGGGHSTPNSLQCLMQDSQVLLVHTALSYRQIQRAQNQRHAGVFPNKDIPTGKGSRVGG